MDPFRDRLQTEGTAGSRVDQGGAREWGSRGRIRLVTPAQAGNTLPSNAATSVVLPHHAVVSPHWVCMEAAVASPQPLWEQFGAM